MANSNAKELILLSDFLPDLKDKSVLQIGSDQDCTKVFADKAKSLVVVDSNKENLKKNQEFNSSFKNIVFSEKSLKDAETFDKSFDLIYSDSNFIDYSDEKILAAVEKSIKLLNLGGLLLLREPFDVSKNSEEGMSPTKFIDVIQSKVCEENGVQYGYDMVFAKPNKALTLLHADVDVNQNVNKMSFLLTKIKLENYNGFKTLKEFMDNRQYTRNGVLRYEKIFGSGFISTGGLETTKRFFETFDLKSNQKVLDVGCGIGGGNFLMAEKFGVDVLGMDLSGNVIGIAWERAQKHKDLNVQFEIGDIKRQKYPNNTFDLIYSRDTLLHIDGKEELFAKFKDWLKPGGKIFITDYCCGPKPWSDNYAAYVASRGYNLLTVKEYGALFTKLGFSNVQAENVTDFFVEMLKAEKIKFEAMKDEFINEFSLEDYEYIINGWNEKLVRCELGNQVWGKFYCEKL